MDLITTSYGSDETDKEMDSFASPQVNFEICSAPSAVQISSQGSSRGCERDLRVSMRNAPVGSMFAPVMGPTRNGTINIPSSASRSGSLIEATVLSELSFNEQFQTFQARGFANDIGTNEILGCSTSHASSGMKKRDKPQKDEMRKVKHLAEVLDDSVCGPWTAEVISEQPSNEGPEVLLVGEEKDVDTNALEDKSSEIANMYIVEPEEEDEKWEKVNERKMSYLLPPRQARGSQASEAASTFHGAALFDYQGRSWNTAPSGIRADDGDHECFIPKKCIKKYSGHTKGVQAVEFFPGTGHLLLSGSMDGKCKVWDVMSDRNVRRTYSGHTEGVRSVCMNHSGESFLSSSFDRYIRLWNVETGQAYATFSNRKMGYQVKFSPTEENVFLLAASDNRIYQWDTRSGSVVQEYNYHLQACNSITFFDNGRKFVSTSDDKKVLVWEYDIPVPIKYIAEPDMHSIPSVSLHPSGNFFAGQSMDNTIVVYSCAEKVKQLKKRTFSGHNNSGYACQVNFSPNGQFLMSGDGLGKLYFWDWKSGKTYRKFQAHDNGPTMGSVWHPLLPSMVATCGWDGLIKLWE